MLDLAARVDWFKASILPHERELRARLRRTSTAEADLDDVVSEALVRAYGTEDWASIVSGRHYLFRIARNVLIDQTRRSALIAFDSLEDAGGHEPDRRTEAAISARDELRQVQRAIETMPPQCRRVFVLRRVHERSIAEIAAEMELSISTVEKHLGKAVALLARAIAEIEEGSFDRGGPATAGRARAGRGVPAGAGGLLFRAAAR